MKRLFTQTAEYKTSNTFYSDFLQKLPEVIYKYTNWEYKSQQRSAGCFLKPTFRNMPYRNSFVPEIDIVVSNHEAYTMLHITGQPVKFVRIFMALWFGFLSLMEVFLLILAITCSGKLKLDTEGVIFVQKLYNGRRPQNIFWTKRTPKQTGDLP